MWAKLPKVCVTCHFWDKKTLFFSSLGLIPASKRASCLVRRRRGDGTTRHSVGTIRHSVGTTRHLGFPVRHFVGTTRHFVLGAVHDRLPPRCRSGWGGGRGGDVQGKGGARYVRPAPASRGQKNWQQRVSRRTVASQNLYRDEKTFLSGVLCTCIRSGCVVISRMRCKSTVCFLYMQVLELFFRTGLVRRPLFFKN